VGVWRRAPWGFALAAAWLLFTWWAGEGFGMMLSGMGTDPNSVPLLGLLIAGSAIDRPAPTARCGFAAAAPDRASA
jgi:hypothetical protein